MKKIAILGSTGSIGESTLKVVRHLKDQITVTALAAKSNIDLLEKQAKEFHPKLIAVFDQEAARSLKKRLPHIEVVSGIEGLNAVASHNEANFVVSAISGTLGLLPTIAAIEACKTVGLANKEALVSGGALIMALAKKNNVTILPIDSEHSAIFQCLQGQSKESVRRLILTASGGPFHNYTEDQLKSITVEKALKHPTWTMGSKVTIDSSTLMNKGLEVIEAHWLFNMSVDNISVVIHPQSIIHSLVEFVDNSLLAQMGESTMTLPIQYALTYPNRVKGVLPCFDFTKHPTLQFFLPDTKKFKCLDLSFHALRIGGTLPCYMNAANEILVHRFLNKEISWHEIAIKLEYLMERHEVLVIKALGDILYVDEKARAAAAKI